MNERCSVLAVRIAEFHKRQSIVMEAKSNQNFRDYRHPQQKLDVVDYAKVSGCTVPPARN